MSPHHGPRIPYPAPDDVDAAPQTLVDKHFLRKHGPKAYYGQEGYSRKS